MKVKIQRKMKSVFMLIFCLVLVSCQKPSYRKAANTLSNKKCLTTCVSNWAANYCYYGLDERDHCENDGSNAIGNQYFTVNHKDPQNRYCHSECAKAGQSFYWCYTSREFKDWDYCSPSAGVSYNNNRCLSPCSKEFGCVEYTCAIKSRYNREYCSPRPYNPITTLENVKAINQGMNNKKGNQNLCRAMHVDHDQDSPLKISWKQQSRRKRYFPDRSNFDVRALVNQFEEMLPIFQITEAGRAPLQYTTLLMPDGVEVLQTMHALLRPETTPRRGTARLPYPAEAAERMNELNAEGADDIGHMLALSLGGPSTSAINVVPQHEMTNRNAGRTAEHFSLWRNVERNLQAMLLNPDVSSIHWWLVAIYGNDLETEADRRPTDFGLFYTIFYNETLGREPYESGNCLFANPPGGGGDPI